MITPIRLIALVVGSVYGSKREDAYLPISNRVNIIAQAAINVAMLSMIKTLQLLKKEKVVGKKFSVLFSKHILSRLIFSTIAI